MSQEIVKIPKSAYGSSIGGLGIIKNNAAINWYTCRDRFQTDSEPTDVMNFIFHTDNDKVDNVIEFMKIIEQIIDLPDDQCLVLSKTDQKNTLHVKMSSFWKYRLRRSLLTAFLRCGMYYTSHDAVGFDKALWSYPYTSSTKYAVQRFLSGYTASKYNSGKRGFSGWQNLFAYASQVNTDKILVKKKKVKKVETSPVA